jgi:type VII secretion protein EccB
MPSTPTTKSQVQAYRFVLRRMQSALVRKDAVMLHDPMRTHTRATIVGVCIAAVGVVGFLVWGLLSPDPKPPNEDAILISKQSGQVYVLINNPKQLIPTFNLASARLLLVARQTQNQQGQQGASANAAAIPSGVNSQAKAPTMVDDKELKDIPRGRLTGIQNGPDLLPTADQRISPTWAVCDRYKLDPSLNNPAGDIKPDTKAADKAETTVLGGVANLGRELDKKESLLVQSDDKQVYLVYRTPVDANITNANAVRAKVNMTNSAVTSAFNLHPEDLRLITTGLLNTIPEAPELVPPDIPERGSDPDGQGVAGLKVGSVFSVERAGQPDPDYYVLLKSGKEKVKKTTADLIRFANSVNAEQIKPVPPSDVAGIPDVDQIDDRKSPEVLPEVLKAVNYPVACLGWNVVGEGENADEHTALHVGNVVPFPKKPDGTDNEGVKISTPGPNGQRIQRFFMPPGRAAVVRGATSNKDFRTGPIYLVSDRGVKFGVPDSETANVLGLSDQKPAPQSIMSLLPDGASLNTKDVLQSYDSVPVAAGTFESTTAKPPGG